MPKEIGMDPETRTNPTTEEQQQKSLATAVPEKEDTEHKPSDDTKKDSDQQSEKPQVELEFKIFQTEKDKEIAKKAKELAKKRFDDLQNTSATLNLSKLEQSFVKMLSPDVFAYIDSQTGELLGTLSTAKKEEPGISSVNEKTYVEELDGKRFEVIENTVTNEEVGRKLIDAEYVEKEKQEVAVSLPEVPEDSLTNLRRSLADESGEFDPRFFEEVEENGEKVIKPKHDALRDAVYRGEITQAEFLALARQANALHIPKPVAEPKPYREHPEGFGSNQPPNSLPSEEDVARELAAAIKRRPGDPSDDVIKEGAREVVAAAQRYSIKPPEISVSGNQSIPVTSVGIDALGINLRTPDRTQRVFAEAINRGHLGRLQVISHSTDRNGYYNLVLMDPDRPLQKFQVSADPNEAQYRGGKNVTGGGAASPLDPETAAAVAEAERILLGTGRAPAEARRMAEEMVAQEVIRKRLEQQEARAISAQARKFSEEWDTEAGARRLFDEARRIDSSLPTFDEIQASGDRRAMVKAFFLAREAAGLPMVARSEAMVEAMSPFYGKDMPEAETRFDLNKVKTFNDLYRGVFGVPKPPNINSIKDLSEKDQDRFIHNLPADSDMNAILKDIVENSGTVYPGQDLSIVLKTDNKMGLNGRLIRLRVEQLIAAEEFDEDKPMRQENLGSLMQGIAQFLSAEPELQAELRKEVYTRLKLHETTLIARYVGVDKLADQMSNFYPDEFKIIMDTRLFRDAVKMIEADDGVYFKKGMGLLTREREEATQKSERYEPTTLKMALLLMPNLSEDEWKAKGFKRNRERETVIEITRRYAEKTNLAQKKFNDERLKGIKSGGDLDYPTANLQEVINEVIKETGRSLSADQIKELKDLILNRSTLSRLITRDDKEYDEKNNEDVAKKKAKDEAREKELSEMYKLIRLGFDEKDKEDEAEKGPVQMGRVIDKMFRDGKIPESYTRDKKDEKGILLEKEKQRLIDVFNEANRALGLSIRIADIYGTSTRYDGLIDKQGRLIKPKAILKFPTDLNWKHILLADKDEDEEKNEDYAESARLHLAMNLQGFIDDLKRDNPTLAAEFDLLRTGKIDTSITNIGIKDEKKIKEINEIREKIKKRVKKEISSKLKIYLRDPKNQQEAQKLLDEYVKKYRNVEIDLSNTRRLDTEPYEELTNEEKLQKRALDLIRDLKYKVIRDTQTKAIRQMIIENWENIDFDRSLGGGRGPREYKKAMWNQIQLEGINKDTKGKLFLRKYASTDVVALTDDNARGSILDQMEHWGDDFQNMKKHGEELKVGARLRKALIESDPGLFNSTSRLNDPLEHLRKIKEYLTDWTQEHRDDYMDFLSEGVVTYLAKYNSENDGYHNANIVAIKDLMRAMINGSVIKKKKKEEIEAQLYGSHFLSEVGYVYKKGDWFAAIFEFFQDIFKESTKVLVGK